MIGANPLGADIGASKDSTWGWWLPKIFMMLEKN